MSDIKIPVKWVKEKKIKFSLNDVLSNGGINSYKLTGEGALNINNNAFYDHHYITEFADRENTGKQPVADWVPIDAVLNDGHRYNKTWAGELLTWDSNGSIAEWKPNIDALYKIYLAEKKISAMKKSVWDNAPEWATMYGEMIGATTSKYYANDNFFTSDKNLFDKYKFGLGPHYANEEFTCKQSRSKQKEDNKLKLSKDDVGEKFENDFGQVFKIELCGGADIAVTDNDGYIFVCDYCGVFENKVTKPLVKRHEPRWWLKDIPDADLFVCNWLACDKGGIWYGFGGEEPLIFECGYDDENGRMVTPLKSIRMPNLTSDEWKLSKISIKELREWQLNNNAE